MGEPPRRLSGSILSVACEEGISASSSQYLIVLATNAGSPDSIASGLCLRPSWRISSSICTTRMPSRYLPCAVVNLLRPAPNASMQSVDAITSAAAGVLTVPKTPRLCAAPLNKPLAFNVVETGAPIRSASPSKDSPA